jgi:hypothetical protein
MISDSYVKNFISLHNKTKNKKNLKIHLHNIMLSVNKKICKSYRQKNKKWKLKNQNQIKL